MRVCTVEDCDSELYARETCCKHYKRLLKHGDPLVCKPGGGFRGYGTNHPHWKDRSITYRSAHMRVQRERGKASAHLCECGSPAHDWAYDHSDPNPLSGMNGKYLMTFSPDVDRYLPMCRPCHKDFDKGAA